MSENTDKQVNEIVNIVEQAILNVIKDRAYPKSDVVVYIDENAAYKAAVLKEKIQEAQGQIDGLVNVEKNTSLVSELNEQLNEVMAELELSKYVFSITGISEGKRDDAFAKAREEFKVEYEENKNPFTGETVKIEIENRARDRFLTNLIWELSIEKITAPDGSIQESISHVDAGILRESLPASANILINESIDKLRAASAAFLLSVGEDFLAKS
jgi:hypothetical protein